MKRLPRMHVRPIRTEADYDRALKDIARYFDKPPARGSTAAIRFNALSVSIADYEKHKWPIKEATSLKDVRRKDARSSQHSLLPLAGSGKGLWRAEGSGLRRLRDEWER